MLIVEKLPNISFTCITFLLIILYLLTEYLGDIGARFKWDAEKFLPDFSISPVSGYISPGMDVTFEVLFHPLDINSDIRYEVSFGVTFSLIIIFHNIEDKINRLVCCK